MNIQFDDEALNQTTEPRVQIIGIPYPDPEFRTDGTPDRHTTDEPELPSEPTDEETIRMIERW